MRTKLFLAFFAVIAVALVSNFLYENLISDDFESYVQGRKEDTLYWILAAVEGSYSDGKWNMNELSEAVHWGIMFGFDIRIEGSDGKDIIKSTRVISDLSHSMKQRMHEIINMDSARGEYEPYPLYRGGKEIGTMLVREFRRFGSIDEKEAKFRERGKMFLLMSFVIAGGGALFLSLFFTLFLSRPLKRMKSAVESMAKGDFSVRLASGGRDEIGRLAESFNFMADALEREENLRKHLTSNIAHELRTPLAVMKAQTEAMVDGIVDVNAQSLESLKGEVEKLVILIKGIEDITKAEASFFSKKAYSPVNLKEFLGGITSKITPFAEEKKLELRFEAGEALTVMTDPDKLEKIVRNILTNAIKNTHSGSVAMNFGKKEGMFFIDVTDTGTGIPEDKKELIFRRFYRGEGSKGIGLGLSIVKELIDVMGGTVEVKSRVGEGSTFRVLLPLDLPSSK